MSEQLLLLLKSVRRKRKSLAEVREAFFTLNPDLLANPERNGYLYASLIELAAAQRILLPAESGGSWESRGTPPLPLWIQVVDESSLSGEQDYSSVSWVPDMGFWPMLRSAALPSARAINDFLLKRKGQLTFVPIKERSLEIFGDEKKLDELRSGEFLFGGRLPLSAIGAFIVPFPLAYRTARVSNLPVLVIENHTTFWSFGEWNETTKRYSAVVYGVGNAFRSSEDALLQVLREVGGTRVEYFGDLDPKGVSIPALFNKSVRNSSALVAPATEFYRCMLESGVRRPLASAYSQPYPAWHNWLGDELGGKVYSLWHDGHWIPQESIGIEFLRDQG